MELTIYLKSIQEIINLWEHPLIKIKIEKEFIKNSLLKDIGLIIKGLGRYNRKYQHLEEFDGKGIVEARRYLRESQNYLISAFFLIPELETKSKRGLKLFKQFDHCETNLKKAYEQLERPELK